MGISIEDYIKTQKVDGQRQKLFDIASRARAARGVNLPDDVINEYYDLTGHESSRSHYERDGKTVKLGPPTKYGRAIGYSQILESTAQPYKDKDKLDPYKEEDNIEMGMREFYKGDQNDSIARRLAYVGGPGNGALRLYREKGIISDERMYPGSDSQETYRQYIERTGGMKGLNNYIQGQGNGAAGATTAPAPNGGDPLAAYIKSQEAAGQPGAADANDYAPKPIAPMGTLPPDITPPDPIKNLQGNLALAEKELIAAKGTQKKKEIQTRITKIKSALSDLQRDTAGQQQLGGITPPAQPSTLTPGMPQLQRKVETQPQEAAPATLPYGFTFQPTQTLKDGSEAKLLPNRDGLKENEARYETPDGDTLIVQAGAAKFDAPTFKKSIPLAIRYETPTIRSDKYGKLKLSAAQPATLKPGQQQFEDKQKKPYLITSQKNDKGEDVYNIDDGKLRLGAEDDPYEQSDIQNDAAGKTLPAGQVRMIRTNDGTNYLAQKSKSGKYQLLPELPEWAKDKTKPVTPITEGGDASYQEALTQNKLPDSEALRQKFNKSFQAAMAGEKGAEFLTVQDLASLQSRYPATAGRRTRVSYSKGKGTSAGAGAEQVAGPGEEQPASTVTFSAPDSKNVEMTSDLKRFGETITGTARNEMVFKNQPTAQQLTDANARRVFGEDYFPVAAEYNRITGKQLMSLALGAPIEDYFDPETKTYQIAVTTDLTEKVKRLMEAYREGGTGAIAPALKNLNRNVMGDIAFGQAQERVTGAAERDMKRMADHADLSPIQTVWNEEEAEKTTRAAIKESMTNPSWWTIAEEATAKGISDGMNPLGAVYRHSEELLKQYQGIGQPAQTEEERDKQVEDKIAQIRKDFGSLKDYQEAQNYIGKMDTAEWTARGMGNYLRTTLNTVISSNLQGADVIDSILEKIDPIQQILPQAYRPNLRNLGNLLGYTVAVVNGQGDKFLAATDKTPAQERLFYQIGSQLQKFLGEDQYIKNDNPLGVEKLTSAMGSGTGFILTAMLAPELAIETKLGEFGIAAAGAGAVGEAGNMYQQARNKGQDENTALLAGGLGIFTGATEGFGIGGALARSLNQAEKKSLVRAFVEWVKTGESAGLKQVGKEFIGNRIENFGEEFGQETFQNTTEDAFWQYLAQNDKPVATRIYNIIKDLPKTTAQNIVENGLVAGLSAELLGAPANIANRGSHVEDEELPAATGEPAMTAAAPVPIDSELKPGKEAKPTDEPEVIKAEPTGRKASKKEDLTNTVIELDGERGTVEEDRGNTIKVNWDNGKVSTPRRNQVQVVEGLPASEPGAVATGQEEEAIPQETAPAAAAPAPKAPPIVSEEKPAQPEKPAKPEKQTYYSARLGGEVETIKDESKTLGGTKIKVKHKETGAEHVIQKPDGTGKGNQTAVPVVRGLRFETPPGKEVKTAAPAPAEDKAAIFDEEFEKLFGSEKPAEAALAPKKNTQRLAIEDLLPTNRDGESIEYAKDQLDEGFKPKTPKDEPIIVVKGENGKYEIADGFHRVAQAVIDGDTHIVADIAENFHKTPIEVAAAQEKKKGDATIFKGPLASTPAEKKTVTAIKFKGGEVVDQQEIPLDIMKEFLSQEWQKELEKKRPGIVQKVKRGIENGHPVTDLDGLYEGDPELKKRFEELALSPPFVERERTKWENIKKGNTANPSGFAYKNAVEWLGRINDATGRTLQKQNDITVTAKVKEAASNVGKGLDAAASGLAKLFGDPNFKGTGMPAFDEKTYAAARPHFEEAYAHFKSSAKNVREAMGLMLKTLNEKYGFAPETLRLMKPHILRFMEDAETSEKNALQTDEKGSIGKTEGEDVKQLDNAADQGNGQRGGRVADAVGDGELLGERLGQHAGERKSPEGNGSAEATDTAAKDIFTRPGESPGDEKRTRKQSPSRRRDTNDGGSSAAAASPNYRISTELDFARFSQRQLYLNNVEAIRIIKSLDEKGRNATPEEQAILARYVGWGGIKQAFDKNNPKWATEYKELQELLSPEEYRAAKASILNAHYTSRTVVDAVWAGLSRLGFKTGRVIEPSMGVGNFFGLMPDAMRKSFLTGVELDSITGKIASNLYPKATVHSPMGFQDVYIFPESHDVAVGNPPFGAESIYDKNNKDISDFKIHSFFFAKSIEALRPRGMLAMVVSKGLLDAADSQAAAARTWLSDRAKLIGAIRLPNTAFQSNAGTEVTTDIIFLEKLPEDGKGNAAEWNALAPVTDKATGEEFRINKYFVDHPEMMLGEMSLAGKMYGPGQPTLSPRENQDLDADLATAIENLPEKIYQEPTTREIVKAAVAESQKNDQELAELIPAELKPYNFFKKDGKFYQKIVDPNGMPLAVDIAAEGKTAERLTGLIELRDGVRELLNREADEKATDAELDKLRKELNTSYDAFVREYGFVNSDTNKRAFYEDADYPLLLALEKDFDRGIGKDAARKAGVEAKAPTAEKADIFSRRTVNPTAVAGKVKSAKDSLLRSMNEKGTLDLPFMAEIYDKPVEGIIDELGDLIYEDPAVGWVTNDEYLSGDVKTKLAAAREAMRENVGYERNVEALEKVQPADIEPMDIFVKLGSNWIPEDVYALFVKETIDGDFTGKFNTTLGKYLNLNISSRNDALNKTKYGTERASAARIMTSLLNNKFPKVYDKVMVDGEAKLVVNAEETAKAQAKGEELAEEFSDWLWRDSERRQMLAGLYNEKFNRRRTRVFDGSHLTFPGMNVNIELRPHQKNFVFRSLQSGVALADHVVGAGKTYAAIATVMESRRLGLMKKPMMTVPNHLVEQWAKDFKKLYPGANVLAASRKDFAKPNRQKLFAKIATGDWDAVIVAHSSFQFIKMPHEAQRSFLMEQIDEIAAALEVAKSEQDSKRDPSVREMEQDSKRDPSVREMEQAIAKITERVKKLSDVRRDDILSFDQMGIDGLFVDEAHEFKNLFFATAREIKASIGNPQGSQKAFDMFMKTRYIMDNNNKRNLFFLTGTPVSNSIAEVFHMQRFLQYDTLKAHGLQTFDAWANTYGRDAQDWEMDAGNRFRQKVRFTKFGNLPELKQLWGEVADTVTNIDLKADAEKLGKRFPLPKFNRTKVIAERSPDQAAYIGIPTPEYDHQGNVKIDNETGIPVMKYDPGTVIYRMENWYDIQQNIDAKENPLRITTHARQAGLDFRLIRQDAVDFPASKINRAVENIFTTWQKEDHRKGTQLVFIDLSTPKAAKAEMAAEVAAKEPTYFIRKNDGNIRHVDGVPTKLIAAPDMDFFSAKEDRRVYMVELSSGSRVAEGFTKQEAMDRANAVIAAKGLSAYKRSIADKPMREEEIERYVQDWHLAEEQKAARREDAGTAEEGAEEPQEGISFDDIIAATSKSNFSAYDDIRTKLIGRGIPADQIAFIHSFNTDIQKQTLFNKVNRGDIRVLLGSTKKMGAGMNVQSKLVALHNIDVPWKPSDLEQRLGRAIRQGNEFYELDPDGFIINIFDYATEKTYDARMWEIVETKGTAIDRFRSSTTEREIEDVSEESANAAEMKASATGDPRILESMQLKTDIKLLEIQEKNWKRGRYDLEKIINSVEKKDDPNYRFAESYRAEIERSAKAPKTDDLNMVMFGKNWTVEQFTDKDSLEKLAGTMKEQIREARTFAKARDIGSYRGFDLRLTAWDNAYRIDAFNNKINLGSARYELTDKWSPSGLITRLENMIEKNLPATLADYEDKIKRLEASAVTAKQEIHKPFAKADQLKELKDRSLALITELRASQKKKSRADEEETDEDTPDLKSIIGRKGAEGLLGSGIALRLERAKTMRAQGKNNKSIFYATGWELDMDGHWKYDLMGENVNTELMMQGQKKGLTFSLPEAVDMPALFKAYPELKDFSVRFDAPANMRRPISNNKPVAGWMDWENKEIVINRGGKLERLIGPRFQAYREEYFSETLIHEVQHAIQHIEGFPSGDLRWQELAFDEDDGFFWNEQEGDYATNAGEVEARNAEYRAFMNPFKRLNTPISETEFLDFFSKNNKIDAKWWVDRETGEEGEWWNNEPDLKRLEDEMAKEFLARKFKETKEIASGMKFERDGERLKVNLDTQEVLRRAKEEADIKTGRRKLGDENTESSFSGVFYKPSSGDEIIEVLRNAAKQAAKLGYEDQAANLNGLANEMEAARKAGKGTLIAYVFDERVPHEAFHQASFLGAIVISLKLRHEHANELDSHIATKKSWDNYFSQFSEYVNLPVEARGAVIREELAAYIAGGELETLGLTKEEADDYINLWFDSYITRNGIESLEEFERVDGDVQRIIQQIKEAFQDKNVSAAADEKSQENTASGEPTSDRSNSPPQGDQRFDREETGDEDGRIRRLASLPATLRAAGIEAEDVMYDRIGDIEAKREAAKILAEEGVAGSINLLNRIKEPDAIHAQLGFMVARTLTNAGRELELTNPAESAALLGLAREFSRDLSRKHTKAGQFNSAARVAQNSTESLMDTAEDIVKGLKGDDATLSPEEAARWQDLGRKGEDALAKLSDVRRQLRTERARVKRMQDQLDGKTKTRKGRGKNVAARQKLVNMIKDQHSKELNTLIDSLRKKFQTEEGDAFSIAEPPSTSPMEVLEKMENAPPLDPSDVEQLGRVGAMILTEGIASSDEVFLPDMFYAQMKAMFGDAISQDMNAIYWHAMKVRDGWLNNVRREQRVAALQRKADTERGREHLEEIVSHELSEELTDDEVDEILFQQSVERRKRNAVEKIHRLASGFPKVNVPNDLKTAIAEAAPNEDVAFGAGLFAAGASKTQWYEQVELVKDLPKKDAEKLFVQSQTALKEAKNQVEQDRTGILAGVAESSEIIKNIEDELWKARQRAQNAQNEIAQELERLKSGKAWYFAKNFYSKFTDLMRDLSATGEFSFVFLQGGRYVIAEPIRTLVNAIAGRITGRERQAPTITQADLWKTLPRTLFADVAASEFIKNPGAAFLQIWNDPERGFGRIIQAIESHPLFVEAIRMGVQFSAAGKVGTGVKIGEEQLDSAWAHKFIPPIRQFDNSMAAFLDMMRMLVYERMSTQLKDAEYTLKKNEKEFEAIAKDVNRGTGKANKFENFTALQSAIDTTAKLNLNFAINYTVSRYQMLGSDAKNAAQATAKLVTFQGLPKGAQRVMLERATYAYGALITRYALMALIFGAAVSFDPDDDDFLKFKFGKLRYDGTLGWQSELRFIFKLMQTAWHGNRVPNEVIYDLVTNSLHYERGKLNVIPAFVVNSITGKDMTGQDFSPLDWTQYARLMVPITYRQIPSTINQGGWGSLAVTLPLEIFGMRSSVYADRPEEWNTPALKLAGKIKAMKKSWLPPAFDTPVDQQTWQEVGQLKARSRAGEDVSAEVMALKDAGKIPDAIVKDILGTAKHPLSGTPLLSELVNDAKMSDKEIDAVYKIANKDEQQQLDVIRAGREATAAKKEKSADRKEDLTEAIKDLPAPVMTELNKHDLKLPETKNAFVINKVERQIPEEEYLALRQRIWERVSKVLGETITQPFYTDASDEQKKKKLEEKINEIRKDERDKLKTKLLTSSLPPAPVPFAGISGRDPQDAGGGDDMPPRYGKGLMNYRQSENIIDMRTSTEKGGLISTVVNADNEEDRQQAIRQLANHQQTRAERELIDAYRENPLRTALRYVARNPVFLKYKKK